MKTNYKKLWNNYLHQYSVPDNKISGLINDLKDRYSEEHRFYHNVNHIYRMVTLLFEYKNEIHNFESIFYAAWFHDVIYDTRKPDNEEKSAEYAIAKLTDCTVDKSVIKKTANLVRITKTHSPTGNTFDEKIFIDSDLAILGADSNTYTKYFKSIRQEYSWVEQDTYNKKRKEFLNTYLEKKNIFFTDMFIKEHGPQARLNLQSEIEYLSKTQESISG